MVQHKGEQYFRDLDRKFARTDTARTLDGIGSRREAMTTGNEVLEAYNMAVEIRDFADEMGSYSASRGGLEERERCRKAIEAKAKELIRKLQQ